MPNTSHFQSLALAIWCGVFCILTLVITVVLIILKRKKAAFLIAFTAASVIPLVLAQNIDIISSPGGGNELFTTFSATLYVLSAFASTLLALFLAFRLFGSHISDGRTLDHRALALEKAVTGILDSEMFLTALRSALPQGKEDPQYGLDYIPYMLHSIDERRTRAVISARLFLLATGVAALLFSTAVMYFGYILVNEAAAGSAKTLADLTRATQEASLLLRSDKHEDAQLQRDIIPVLDKLDSTDPGAKNKDTRDTIHQEFLKAKNTGNFYFFLTTITMLLPKLSKDGQAEKAYANALGDASAKLLAFLNNRSTTLSGLAGRTEELKTFIPKAEDALSKPENRTPEIIKRLALGVVISTFFLVLLRSLVNLYKTRYLQVLEAERDDFAVRRFYVVFKSSQASDEQRKAVLASFMTLASADGSQPKEPADESAKREFEVIKELLQALSKKL
jgi:hypothetical protein